MTHPHFGDPCFSCGVPHDDVPPGPCSGAPLREAVETVSNGIKFWRSGGADFSPKTTAWFAAIELILSALEEKA